MQIRPSWDLAAESNPECLGLVYAVLGKFQHHHPDLSPRLLLVKQCERIGELNPAADDVYKVVNVSVVAVNHDPASLAQLGLKPCPKHHHTIVDEGSDAELTAEAAMAFDPLAKLKDAVKSTAGQVKNPFINKTSTVLTRHVRSNLTVPNII